MERVEEEEEVEGGEVTVALNLGMGVCWAGSLEGARMRGATEVEEREGEREREFLRVKVLGTDGKEESEGVEKEEVRSRGFVLKIGEMVFRFCRGELCELCGCRGELCEFCVGGEPEEDEGEKEKDPEFVKLGGEKAFSADPLLPPPPPPPPPPANPLGIPPFSADPLFPPFPPPLPLNPPPPRNP